MHLSLSFQKATNTTVGKNRRKYENLAESVLTYERNYKLDVWNGRDKWKREMILPTILWRCGSLHFHIKCNQWSGKELKVRKRVKVLCWNRTTYILTLPKQLMNYHKLSRTRHFVCLAHKMLVVKYQFQCKTTHCQAMENNS